MVVSHLPQVAAYADQHISVRKEVRNGRTHVVAQTLGETESEMEISVPFRLDPTLPFACRTCEHLKAIGRLKPGIAMETARADIDAVQAGLRAAHPSDYSRATMTLAVR